MSNLGDILHAVALTSFESGTERNVAVLSIWGSVLLKEVVEDNLDMVITDEVADKLLERMHDELVIEDFGPVVDWLRREIESLPEVYPHEEVKK
jgi:hypothetical protein